MVSLPFKDCCIRDMEGFEIDFSNWQEIAEDRSKWRKTVKEGTESNNVEWLESRKRQRALSETRNRHDENRRTRAEKSSAHNLRNTSNDLKLPLMKIATGQRCFSFRGVRSWNSLSVESKKP